MRFARLLGYAVLIASAVYFFAALSRHANSLPVISWNQSTFAVLVGCLGLYLAQVSAAGLAWHFWLQAAREVSRPPLAVSLFAISQFAKYVPGGIAQHIARVALGERHGLSRPGMIVTIALEQSWALVAGVAVAVTVTLLLGSVPDGITLPSPLTWAPVVVLAMILPPALIWLGGHRRPPFLDRWLGAWRAAHPRARTVAACFLLYAAGIANSGWNVDLIARHVLGAQEGHVLLAISVFAVAWVAGFVTLVSPGGIGVREAVLLAGLTPAYGPGIALAAAMSYRVVTSLGDGLAFLLGLLIERRLLPMHPAQDHQSP
jgi:glycosyltransferase 2 family protein